MKRFIVFAGYKYYPCGGWDDFVGEADSLEEAKMVAREKAAALDTTKPWWHIVDTESKEAVFHEFQDRAR